MFADYVAQFAFGFASAAGTFDVERPEFAAAEPFGARFATSKFAAADYALRCSVSSDLAPADIDL